MAAYGDSGYGSLPLSRIIGHHGITLLTGIVVGVVLLNFRPQRTGPTYVVAALSLALAAVVAFIALRRHDRTLCEHCAAQMPLNPAGTAAGMRNRFWLVHNATGRAYVLGYLLVIVGSNFLSTTPGRLVWAAVTLSLIYPLRAYDAHRRYQPWCPWCASGGGGSTDHTGAPEPTRGPVLSR